MSLQHKILRAMEDGTYWVNWKGHYVPLSLISINYAQNIRHVIRRRLKPEQYEGKPLYVSLGRIRRHHGYLDEELHHR